MKIITFTIEFVYSFVRLKVISLQPKLKFYIQNFKLFNRFSVLNPISNFINFKQSYKYVKMSFFNKLNNKNKTK